MLAPLTSQHMITLMWDGCTNVLASYKEMQIRDSRQHVFARRIFPPLPTSGRLLRLNYVTFPGVLGASLFSTTVTALHGMDRPYSWHKHGCTGVNSGFSGWTDKQRTFRSLQRG